MVYPPADKVTAQPKQSQPAYPIVKRRAWPSDSHASCSVDSWKLTTSLSPCVET